MAEDLKNALRDRFVGYTKFDTMSDGGKVGEKRPSTDGQLVLLEYLKKELEALGIETYLGPEAVVKGVLKGNVQAPTIGFMAHVDTADDVPGNGVKARIHSYKGGDIVLEDGIVISAKDNPLLGKYLGGEVVTSDGTTLLGADDKAGVAIIMELVKYLVEHPEVRHGDIEVYFTPDEETGAGMDQFPYDLMDSVVCYTLDGGEEGEIETECFNAATIKLSLHGNSIHLGSARGKMVNALVMASAIINALPHAESPEATDGRYGYYCPLEIEGTAVEAKLNIYIRDFDMDSFNERIENVRRICAAVASLYHGSIDVDVHVSYHNMAEVNKKNPKALEAIYTAGREKDIPLKEALIRGGTDGARLCEAKGVSSPNLFTGGHNYHSKREWLSIDAMYSSFQLVLGIIDFWSRG